MTPLLFILTVYIILVLCPFTKSSAVRSLFRCWLCEWLHSQQEHLFRVTKTKPTPPNTFPTFRPPMIETQFDQRNWYRYDRCDRIDWFGIDIYVDENGRERNDMMSWRMINARTLVLGNVWCLFGFVNRKFVFKLCILNTFNCIIHVHWHMQVWFLSIFIDFIKQTLSTRRSEQLQGLFF